MNNFMTVSPLKILEKSSHKGLGKGNLAVLISRAGVGKTACLIHIAFDKLFRKEKIVHVSLEDLPEKVTSYYNVIFADLANALKIENEPGNRGQFEKNRMILAYLNQSFALSRLRENLQNLIDHLEFSPDTLIVDGLDFNKAERGLFEDFKNFAADFHLEVWFSALSHRHIREVNERGIPYPLNNLDDLFSIIIQLQPTTSGIFLNLLKDHETPRSPVVSLRLDPITFLATA